MKTISKTLFALTATALLAACQTTPSGTQVAQNDECKASSFQSLVGTPAAALDKNTLPDRTRILYPNSVATMDYRLDRLNIHVDAQGQIVRVVCG